MQLQFQIFPNYLFMQLQFFFLPELILHKYSVGGYYSEYLSAGGLEEFYERKYDPKNEEFWKKIKLPGGADDSYVCIGVKASNYFHSPGDPRRGGRRRW